LIVTLIASIRLLAGLALAAPALAFAQDAGSGEAGASARFQLGPLGVTPTFGLTNVGLDTNIFNESAEPVRDYTATFSPGARSWLRVGPIRVASTSVADYLFFARSRKERSINVWHESKVEAPLARFTPRVAVQYGSTRERLNVEIDARVRRHTVGAAGGVRIPFGGRSAIDVEFGRTRYDFDDVRFGGVPLAQALNRTNTATRGSLRLGLTPLTTVVVKAERERDRFEISSVRDAVTMKILPGVEFKPSALFSGSAFVGYQRFDPDSTHLPDSSGLAAAVDLKYVWRDMTSVAVQAHRTLEYSFDADSPYYVATGADFVLRQALGGNWDAVGIFGRQRLSYQPLVGAETQPSASRRDRHHTQGFGVGYWMHFDARIGLTVSHVRRLSMLADRAYSGFRIGGSFTYGF
jgi:hypothetical protein